LTNLLIISDDMAGAGGMVRLKSSYDSIYLRNREMNLESSYQSSLAWLTRYKSEQPEARVTLVETGWPLEAGEKEESLSASLISDIIGLMLQPACRTEDEQGQVQFTDVSQLFAADLMDSAERVLAANDVKVRRCTAAAVAAPELLTTAERKVLLGMGAEVAITHLYLEVRAARARGVPALGVVLPAGGAVPEVAEHENAWVEILCRMAGTI